MIFPTRNTGQTVVEVRTWLKNFIIITNEYQIPVELSRGNMIILTRERITVAMITRQSHFSQIWYFIAVYVINRSWYDRLVIWNFLFSLLRSAEITREIFFNTRKEIPYLRAAIQYPMFFQFRKTVSSYISSRTVTKHAFSVLGRIITEATTQIYGEKCSRVLKTLRIQI